MKRKFIAGFFLLLVTALSVQSCAGSKKNGGCENDINKHGRAR